MDSLYEDDRGYFFDMMIMMQSDCNPHEIESYKSTLSAVSVYLFILNTMRKKCYEVRNANG